MTSITIRPKRGWPAFGFLFAATLTGALSPATNAFAEKTGNGGGAWVCQNGDATGSVRWARLVDLYEARVEFNLEIPTIADGTYLEIAAQVMKTRLRPVDKELHRLVDYHLGLVKANLNPVDADLETVDDALFRIRPAKRECSGGTLSYVQLANFTAYRKVLIQQTLFNDPALSETDKAALLVHEAVYAYLRERYADKDSVRARRMVGLLFSTLSQDALKLEIQRLLGIGLSGAPMKFVRIKPGSFMMGSPESDRFREADETQHQVHITAGFEIQTTEVTQKQYFDVMGINPSHFNRLENCPQNYMVERGTPLCPNNPVEYVSYLDIQEFLRVLNQSSRDGFTYRLPTEAEWEYAARAGTNTPLSFPDLAEIDSYAWFYRNSSPQTREVGQLKPNAFGLHDVHGNVWEWVQDWYGKYESSPVTDPQGPAQGSLRVFRGGSYNDGDTRLRSANRATERPDDRSFVVGFRLVRTR